MRLVDADELKEQIQNGHCNLCKVFDCEACGVNVVLEYIEDAPTVDAEIVVRCQNCKHHGACGYEDIPGWYCADGERRESE